MDTPSASRHPQITPEEDQFHVAFQGPENQEAFYSNYCQDGRLAVDLHPKWHKLAVSADAISSETMMQEGFSLSTPKLKAKRRKAAAAAASSERIQVHGGRIIRSGGGRRDRHSKVCTARGARDRRVRLSPKTAIQFYDVQDRLGYDRPSKAIDWLMNEAKAAIDALDESEPPPVPQAAIAAGGHSSPINKCGIVHSLDHFNNDIPYSSFFSEPLSSHYPYDQDSILHQDGFLPSIPPDLFDPNPEMIRLQRIFHFPGCSQTFCERESLQSSISNNSPINPQFSSFRLPNEEIPNFAAATFAEDEMNKIPASSKPSSFLHHQV